MTYDEIYNGLQIIGGVVLGLTFIVGLATIWAGIKSSNEKDMKARQQEERIAKINLQVQEEARKRAEAESRLIELQNRVAWRYFDQDKFLSVLKSRPKGKAEIVFLKEDSESYLLANTIWQNLVAAEWIVNQPSTGTNNDPNLPFALREGGIIASNIPSLTIAVADKTIPKPYLGDTPLSALMLAFTSCGIKPMQTIPHEGIRPSVGTIRIIVGSRL
jgi:hypothetical protein